MNTNVHNYMCLKLNFNRSQDNWECDLNLTYPPFRKRLIFAHVNDPILNLHGKFIKDIINDNAITAFV